MRIHSVKAAALFGAALTAFAVPSVAFAQDAPAASGQGADEGLTDIIVTAEHRSENLQKVPVSVGVISGDDQRTVQAGGDDTLLALSGRTPSLYIESTTGRIFPRFYIRGLGNIDFYLGASQPVSIIQDDVILEHVVLKSNPVYDVRQVEVLRGPQGSLFGRNTTAGIVKFDTIDPSDTLQARANLSVGSNYTTNLDAGIGGPLIGDVLSFRLSTLIQHRADFVDNTYTGTSADGTATPRDNALGGYDDRNVRLKLLFTPTDKFSIEASGHGRWYDGTSTLFRRNALTKGSNSTDRIIRDQVSYDEAQDNPQAYNTFGGSVRAKWDFGPATLTSITAYETTSGFSRGDTDGGAAANFGGVGFGESQGNIRDLDQWSQELRLASNGEGPLKWQLGGLYFDSRDITDFYQRAFFLTTSAHNPNNWVRLHDVNISYAGFGQVSYAFTPKLTLTAGGRVTFDSKETTLLKTADRADGTVTYTGRRNVKLSDTQPSWDVSLLYAANPSLSLYARVATGFRGPTIQGRSAVFNADFTTADSETIASAEVGFKSTLLNDTLRLNADVFAYRVHDIQLNGNDSNGNGVLFNADKAIAYGLEAQADWRPVPNFQIGLGLSLLHSEIQDKRVYAQVCALSGVVVCTVEDPTIVVRGNTFAQIDGEPLPNAPEYNINLTARYDLPLASGAKLWIDTDWTVQGYTQFVLYRTKEFTSNGNFEGGLRVGYEEPNGKWNLSVFARNITNQVNLKGVIENYLAAVVNEPRVIGVAFGARY